MKNQVTETDFERAIQDKTKRQSFLEKIDLERKKIYIKEIKYRDEDIIDEGNQVGMRCEYPITMFCMGPCLLPFRRSTIVVYSGSFERENNPTVKHFLNTLIDHEVFHAKQLFWHPELLYDREKLEVEAHWNSIIQSERKGLDDAWRARISRRLARYNFC